VPSQVTGLTAAKGAVPRQVLLNWNALAVNALLGDGFSPITSYRVQMSTNGVNNGNGVNNNGHG
jgi:hypothetical protein